MDVAREINSEQRALWNGHAGRAWVAVQDALDEMFRPFEELLVGSLPAGSNLKVLEIGCGAGGISRRITGRLGPGGHCTGIDISAPLIAAARARTADEGVNASFVCADAQDHAFACGSIDAIVSRFGVMFFEDPVAAFANLKRAARDGAMLHCIVWRSPAENPFMTTAERAAAPLLPKLPPRRPNAPGQFAFADQYRVRAILEQSGWGDIEIAPLDVLCRFSADALSGYISQLGPVGVFLANADDATRAHVIARVRPAFDQFVHGEDVRYAAACWTIKARAGLA